MTPELDFPMETAKSAVFFPFPYKTKEDRVRLLAALWAFRINDLPVPANAGYLIGMSDDKDLNALYKDVVACARKNGPMASREGLFTCLRALDIIGYFHGVKCKDKGETKCLGVKVSDKVWELTDRLEKA